MNRITFHQLRQKTPLPKAKTARKFALVSAMMLSLIGYNNIWAAQANCSLDSGVPSTVNFTNTLTHAVNIIWVDSQCVEHVVSQLEPGSSLSKATYKNDVWLSRKVTDNKLVTRTRPITKIANVKIKEATLPPAVPGGTGTTLTLAPAKTNTITSPPNTPFVDPLPIPVTLTPVTSPDPVPSHGPNENPVSIGRQVDAKLNGTTVATAFIGGFTEAFRPSHQKWTQFGGASETTPGFSGKFYESVEMEVPWDFYPAVDHVPASKVWTFVEANTGAIGPVRINAQYGEPVIHRVHNALPVDNGGFGINQTSTHLHNGHVASESDGGPAHFYDAGKFKDYHYPNVRAGFASNVPTSTINGKTVLGDFKETLSTLWFHDHRFDFTSQNVYKGLVSFYTLFSKDALLDTGDETTGLRLPSGLYDVPMIFGDKSFDPVSGQLAFDTTDIDGVLGDKYSVNGKLQPYMNVQKRKYRFRLLNGGPARYYEFFLSNNANFKQLSTNGNLLPSTVTTRSLRLAVAERADVIVDFSGAAAGSKIYLQNRLEQLDGRGPTGKIITPTNLVEFRVQAGAVADNSVIPTTMVPLPDKKAPTILTRSFDFGSSSGAWTVNGELFDPNTISIFPKQNTAEKWTISSGGGWAHPIHMHFEEGQILSRNGKTALVTDDVGRKDTYRIGQASIGTSGTGTLDTFYQWRDFLGDYPIHCHNVVHEDHAMMTLFEIVP